MAATVNFTVGKGEEVTFAGVHETSESDDTPVDISGWTITITVKTRAGVAVFTKTGTVVLGSAGTYTWAVAYADTYIASGVYDIDIWRTDVGGRREMAIGRFEITKDVLYGS